MISLLDKQSLFSELTTRLAREYETLLAAQKATVEGATHEEARPENDKDTRALEQTYLARGQAERVATLRSDLDLLRQLVVRKFESSDRVALGAFVLAQEDNGGEHAYLLSPAGAGEVLSTGAWAAKVVTPGSPLGRSLSGARVDDEIEVRSPSGKRLLTILSIC